MIFGPKSLYLLLVSIKFSTRIINKKNKKNEEYEITKAPEKQCSSKARVGNLRNKLSFTIKCDGCYLLENTKNMLVSIMSTLSKDFMVIRKCDVSFKLRHSKEGWSGIS